MQHHPAMMAGSRDGTTRIYGSILAEAREVTTAAASDVWWFTRKLESDVVPLTLPTDGPPRYKTKPDEKKFPSVACRNCLKECVIIFFPRCSANYLSTAANGLFTNVVTDKQGQFALI
jgi:hypothetical protein